MKVATTTPQPRRETVRTVTDEPPTAPTSAVSEDRIRERAYHCWEEAGCPVGDGVEFWLKAEAELAGKIPAPEANDEAAAAAK